MKLTKLTGLIWYNLVLTAAGLVVLYLFLYNLEHKKSDQNIEVPYTTFQGILDLANMPDSIKEDVSISLYAAALSTEITASKRDFRDALSSFPQFGNYLEVDTLFAAMYKVKQQVDVNQIETYFRVNEGEPAGVQNVIVSMNEIRTGSYVGFVHLLVAMCLAGLLGGVLANMRGIFEFIRESKTHSFPNHLLTPYYLRPVTAILAGVFVFFLANTIVASATYDLDSQQIPFGTMISLLGIAILAGFASQEFMERLKAAASTLFGIQLPVKPNGGNGGDPSSAGDGGGDDPKNESEGDEGGTKKAAKKAATETKPSPPTKSPPRPGVNDLMNRD